MGYDLGAAFLSQQVAKRMIEETLYGKPKIQKKSLFRTLVKKVLK